MKGGTEDVVKTLELHFKHIREAIQRRASIQAKQQWKAKLCRPGGLNRTLAQAIKSENDKLLRSVRVGEGQVMFVNEIAAVLSRHWDGIHQKPEHDPQLWLENNEAYLP